MLARAFLIKINFGSGARLPRDFFLNSLEYKQIAVYTQPLFRYFRKYANFKREEICVLLRLPFNSFGGCKCNRLCIQRRISRIKCACIRYTDTGDPLKKKYQRTVKSASSIDYVTPMTYSTICIVNPMYQIFSVCSSSSRKENDEIRVRASVNVYLN